MRLAAASEQRRDRREDQRRDRGVRARARARARGRTTAYPTRQAIVVYRPVTGGQAGELRVGHALRDEDRGEHDAGHEVGAQRRALVGASGAKPRTPSAPPLMWRFPWCRRWAASCRRAPRRRRTRSSGRPSSCRRACALARARPQPAGEPARADPDRGAGRHVARIVHAGVHARVAQLPRRAGQSTGASAGSSPQAPVAKAKAVALWPDGNDVERGSRISVACVSPDGRRRRTISFAGPFASDRRDRDREQPPPAAASRPRGPPTGREQRRRTRATDGSSWRPCVIARATLSSPGDLDAGRVTHQPAIEVEERRPGSRRRARIGDPAPRHAAQRQTYTAHPPPSSSPATTSLG